MTHRSEPRVLQVALSLNPGGTERLIIELATRLNPAMPTAVCCLDEIGAWAPALEARGIRVSSLGRRPGFRPSLGNALAAAARAHGATVLHAHHYSPFIYAALARARMPRLKVVFTEHGRLSDRGPSPKRRLVNRAFRFASDATVAVSEDIRRHLVAEGFPSDEIQVIYNGIDLGPATAAGARDDVRRALGAADPALVVGTIARLDPVKDLGVLIEALPRLSDLPLQVLVVGDGPERVTLEGRVQALGLSARVRFLGHRDDARAWLAGCDLYVNTSRSEGLSLTLCEAMAAALPIIATRVGGTPELVDEATGLLIDPRDSLGLADAIRTLALDASRRRALGEAGRRRVESQFTLDRMVAEYRDLIEQLD